MDEWSGLQTSVVLALWRWRLYGEKIYYSNLHKCCAQGREVLRCGSREVESKNCPQGEWMEEEKKGSDEKKPRSCTSRRQGPAPPCHLVSWDPAVHCHGVYGTHGFGPGEVTDKGRRRTRRVLQIHPGDREFA